MEPVVGALATFTAQCTTQDAENEKYNEQWIAKQEFGLHCKCVIPKAGSA